MNSIIVITYNSLKYIDSCLEAIKKNTDLRNSEIIVVNNASTDGTKDFLSKQKDIIFIDNEKNYNFAGGNNIAAKKAKGDILIFLNADTEVHKNWLSEIEKTFEENENLGAVGVKLLFPNNTVQHAGVVISPDKTPRHIYYQGNPNLPEVNKEREFQVVTAACVAVPKKVFEEVGGFDEEYKNGLEDVDLCLNIREKGYKIVYTPKSVVTHHESVAPGRFKHNVHNADLYTKRWKDKVVSDENKYYKEDGKSLFWILGQNLRSMSYGPDIYNTRPLYISILRWYYIPYHKLKTITLYLFKGDIKGLMNKIKNKIRK